MSGHKLSSKVGLLALALVGLLTGGCTAVVGGAVFVGLVGVGALAYSCDEPVGVEVWDRTTARTICDAKIIATSEGHETSFAPCYRGYLGTGTWTVTATKPGYLPSVGTVTVEKQRHCSEPTFHSLELTLTPETQPGPAPAPQAAPAPEAPPEPPPPLQSAPAPTPGVAPTGEPGSPPPLQSAAPPPAPAAPAPPTP